MRHRRTQKWRRGQIVVLGPILLIAVAGIVALSIDIGHLVYTRGVLQNAADAGALAAAHVLLDQQSADVDEAEARAAAAAEALALVQLNADDAAADVVFGIINEEGEFEPLGDDDDDDPARATAVRCRVRRDGESPGGEVALFFGPVLGVGSAQVACAAATEMTNQIGGFISGLRPLAVYEGDIVPNGQQMTFYEHELVAPGCFGLLNFDGGACGTPELSDWILNGYDDPIEIDPDLGYVMIDGDPGFRASLKDELQAIEDELIYVVVYDQVTGGGSNADFRCIGFLGIVILDSKMTGNDKYILCRVVGFATVHDASTGWGWSSPNLYKIQLVS